MGFPRRKRKGRARETCRFTTGPIRVEPDRQHVVLPRLGRLKTHESTRKLARRLETGNARILAATISRQGGRWFISFTCQVQRTMPGPRRPQARIGIDLGIRHLAVLSDGRQVGNPAPLEHAQRRLRRLNRQLARRHGPLAPDASRRQPSTRWQQTSLRLARAHARVANVRRNSLHHLTSELAGTYGTVVVERLNVAGMLGNRRVARRIADAAWGELRRQLAYKCAWAGGKLVEADTWYPSSKTCSACGHVKAKLPLSERTYRCEHCGLVLDRDLNAARNLAMTVKTRAEWSPGVARRPETLGERT
jgi:IS605 OrfB family transposase